MRHSGFGYVPLAGLYLPLPLFGLLGFAFLLGVALTRKLRPVVPLVAGIGGSAGLGLFALQWLKIGHLCSLCVTVDTLSVLAALSGFALWKGTGDADQPLVLGWGAWPALGVLAVLAPLSWPALRPAAPVPAGVQNLYQSGKINVVEFADYECPYCRKLHPLLKSVIGSYPGKVNFTRLNLPLHSHQFAQGAALAQVCVREQGQGDAMADRLFAAENLRPEANRDAAKDLGVDLTKYDQCLASGRAERVIDAESKILIDAGLQGLPTTYVGAKTIIGAQSEEVFRDAFDRAERGEGETGVPAPVYWLAVLAIAAGSCWWVARGVLDSDMEQSNSESSAAGAAATHLMTTPGQVPFEVFKALPKTDLHVHLDGSLRLETILELAQAEKVELPAYDVEGLRAAIGCGNNFGSLAPVPARLRHHATGDADRSRAGAHRLRARRRRAPRKRALHGSALRAHAAHAARSEADQGRGGGARRLASRARNLRHQGQRDRVRDPQYFRGIFVSDGRAGRGVQGPWRGRLRSGGRGGGLSGQASPRRVSAGA